MENYIQGKIKKIIYSSPTSPYKVGLFKVKETNCKEAEYYVDKMIGFTGNIFDINDNVDYVLYGQMVNHPKYGIQFACDSYEIKEPSDEESIILYLSSGLFKGIGEKTAQKIVKKFKKETLDIIKNHPEELKNISGMSEKKAREMQEKLLDKTMNQDLIIKLNSYGFSVQESIKLATKHGMIIEKIIRENIYELVHEIPFEKIDQIFLKTGDETDKIRLNALIVYVIQNMCYETGNTIVDKDEVYVNMLKYFKGKFTSKEYVNTLENLIKNDIIHKTNDGIMLYDFYEAERNISFRIQTLNSIKNKIRETTLDKNILDYQKDNKINFSIEQVEAIKGSLKNNFYIITGGPGTGKTTIIATIVSILKEYNKLNNEDIALLAPTGRAAKRMAESVHAPSSTIHKFLKWNKETECFQVNEYNQAREKVIIVDETSMIDIFLFDSLLKGIKYNVKLILIGDEHQLPSIGPGDVLHDLLAMENIESKCLKTIYRVKKDSYITELANDIKNKKYFDNFGNYADFKFIESSDDKTIKYVEQICEKIKEKNIKCDDFQVLVPMYKGQNGIDNLNKKMQDIFNENTKEFALGDKKYRVGDKVIQLVNDVDNNVFNGDLGYIKSISQEDKKIVVTIDYMGNEVTYNQGEFDRFNLAYAISIHKSQGSEYDNVVIILSSSFKRMFYNKLIYTAVTRAKKSLIIIGNYDSLNSSVQTDFAEGRNTYLKSIK